MTQGSGGSLLSWKTSQELGLLKAMHNVEEDSSPRIVKLVEDYDELFHGLGKLKGYQVKLHIDESVQPIAQPHRRVTFHVRQQLDEQLRWLPTVLVIKCIVAVKTVSFPHLSL